MEAPTPLRILPDRIQHPFRNMEEDLLLLYRNPSPASILFRHYGWEFPCWTCGYSQKFPFVRDSTGGTRETIFRRATGGGIVPHFSDWTYTLVVGNLHPAWHRPPRDLYDILHGIIARILEEQFSIPSKLNQCQESLCHGAPPDECFRSPVLSDVLHAGTGEKVAGAAIKKTREGILLQGSIQKGPIPGIDWGKFNGIFAQALATSFGCHACPESWPFSNSDNWEPYRARVHSLEWLEK